MTHAKQVLVAILFISLICPSLNVVSQSLPDPVHFTYSVSQIGSQTFAVHITATMDNGWHIYAQKQPKGAISEPTKIAFNSNPQLTLKGKLVEAGRCETQKIEGLEIEQYMYENKVDFVQIIVCRSAVVTMLTGSISYQACTDEMCLPLRTESFKVVL